MPCNTAGKQDPGDADTKGKRYAAYQSCRVHTRMRQHAAVKWEVHVQAMPPRPHTWRARKTTHAIQTQDTMEQEHQDDDARGKPATPSTPSTTTQGGTQRPAGSDGLGDPGSRKHAPGTSPPHPTHAVHGERQDPTTHDHTNYDPGTAGTPEPRGGETTRGGATRRQLEPEPDQTLSQRTDYSATSRTASTVTRQRTPSQDRTEYCQNTYYSHITRDDAYDPEQDPTPSQHTDYSDRTTNQSTNAAPCRRTPSPDRTEYSAQDTNHCGTPHHEAPHCDNQDDSPGPGPQAETMAAEITQPSPPEDHTHEAPLSVSSGTSGTAMDTHSQLPTPPEAHDPPPESLPSGLDISANHDPMDMDNDPLQDSIQRVLQVAADAHQRPAWSLNRALNETDQRITGTGSNRDPGAYIQELRRNIHNAQQQSPEGVVVQGRETKTGAWTNLTRAPHAEEAVDFIQESDAPPPATLEETAAALVLTLHSWTRGHTIVLHDKTGPPYARTATCRPSIAATGEAHLEWKPEREDDEYTLVHATRHGHREEKEPTPEPAATPPPRPTPRH